MPCTSVRSTSSTFCTKPSGRATKARCSWPSTANRWPAPPTRCADLLDKARQDGQQTAEQIVKAAHAEAESAKQRATRDIGAARDQALAEIWEKTADMAVSVAGRVLSKELTDADHKRLVASAISELPAAPGANGHGGKA